MSKKVSAKKKTQNINTQGATQHVKVLYQNLGGTWYAFADLNDEIFFAPIQLKQVVAPSKKNKKELTPKEQAPKNNAV
jgi:hypothetical protein